MASSHPTLVRTRLSMMMFLEFFIWGGWGITLGGYAGTIGLTGAQIGSLVGITAIGAIISPLFTGLIADRFFPAQWVLAILHTLGGATLIMAGFQTDYSMLMGLMLLNGLFFMPTMALANSIAFRHIPDPAKFPRIAMLGTIGWIVAVLGAEILLGGMKKPGFFVQSGVAGIVLGCYALTLPHTPPKGGAGGDAFGLSALKLFRERNFLVFIVCVTLISIPACSYFFTNIGAMFLQRGYPAPLALTTLCQFAEIVFMFTMPWFVTKLGLKRVLMIGMAAWAIRYFLFAVPSLPLAIVALLLHGFCYSFLYVGSYMYVDKCAPADLKASAQSLLTFVLLGVGWYFGAQFAGLMKDQNPPLMQPDPPAQLVEVADLAAQAAEDDAQATGGKVLFVVKDGEGEDAKVTSTREFANAKLKVTEKAHPFPGWGDPKADTSWLRYTNLSKTVKGWLPDGVKEALGIEEDPDYPDLAETFEPNDDGQITKAQIEAADVFKIDEKDKQEKVEIDGRPYGKEELAGLFTTAHEKLDLDGDVALTRQQWLDVQANRWQPIWLVPAACCALILVLFALGFREKEAAEEEAADAQTEPDTVS